MTDRRRIHIVVRGRVQGVGYRAFVIDTARALGLGGWVRNRIAGTVEAEIVGEAARIDQALAALREGPPQARVREIEIIADEAATDVPAGFDWRPTV